MMPQADDAHPSRATNALDFVLVGCDAKFLEKTRQNA
jgi:hypothetical protein